MPTAFYDSPLVIAEELSQGTLYGKLREAHHLHLPCVILSALLK